MSQILQMAITSGSPIYLITDTEVRMYETINDGEPTTPFMQFGDRVRIEMLDAAGDSIFGAIDQEVVGSGSA